MQHWSMLLPILSIFVQLLCVLGLPPVPPDALYKQPNASIPDRVADLIERMSLKEKAAQLGYPCGNGYQGCGEDILKIAPDGVGGLQTTSIECTNSLQAVLKNKTRLGIPASFFAETTHSGGAPGTTVFPMPCSQGASFNTSLVEQIASINALELRSSGGDHGLSPILQVCTDPRWGRLEENFGEDPFLVSQMGIAALRGLQGPLATSGAGTFAASTYLANASISVTSQAKHFAAYGAGSKDGYTPMGGGPGERTLFEVYLRPWRDFALAGGRGVMAAHNMIDWTPVHASRRMLTDILRNRFGLGSGYIGSDNTNVEGLANYFVGFAGNESDAAVVAMSAGIDQDMPGASFMSADQLVTAGKLDEKVLNRAVSNILTKKFAARLFDAPPADPKMASNINAEVHQQVAYEAAVQGCVLLKNVNHMLPIQPASLKSKTVAVVGPFADGPLAAVAQLGGYSSAPKYGRTTVTIADALRMRKGFNVLAVQGAGGGRGGPTEPRTGAFDDLAHAVEASERADFTLVVVGTMACGCCNRCGNGEAGDRNSLDLEGSQALLVAAISNISASRPDHKFAVVLIHGRPVTFGIDNQLLDKIPALLAAWRPGERGGDAVVDIIFGKRNPSGKLAQSWPRGAGYIHSPSNPWFQPHSSMGRGVYFGSGDGRPISALWPFGWGLSYTSYNFSAATVSVLSRPLAHGRSLENTTFNVSINVKNVGTVSGATPIMVTYHKTQRMVVRNLRDLCGFSKVHLNPGEIKTVTIQIRLSDLARWDTTVEHKDMLNNLVHGAYVVDQGPYDIYVGGCVSMGGVWDDSDTCPPSQQIEVKSAITLAAPPPGLATSPEETPFSPPSPWIYL